MAECYYRAHKSDESKKILKNILKSVPNCTMASLMLEQIILDENNSPNSYKKRNESQKYVIGPWPGGMGVCLPSVLNQLFFCEEHNKVAVIYWNRDC